VAQIATRPVRWLAWEASKKALRSAGSHLLDGGARTLREAANRTVSTGRKAIAAGVSGRPPIQVGIDVAVPLDVAWDKWMDFTALTEGVHGIKDVERDGNRLVGQTSGAHSVDWEAEILDERPHEAFAWRSLEASDCAGLATFHRLSDRLTRIELDLDVLPTGPLETLALSLRLADRRAEAELRRFKARVEFINPDVYEQKARK
jgi:uncharacterized membrane protein